MYECDWKRKLSQLQNIETEIPNILRRDTEESLLNMIREDKTFGFLTCDIECSENLASELSANGFLFPPVIDRQTLTEEHFSDYMTMRMKQEKQKLSKETVVQKFNAKQIFLMTSLAKFYLDLGLKVTNVSQFVQYVGAKTLLPFADKVYKMRVSATYENDEAKSLTSKLFGNSGLSFFLCDNSFFRVW